MIKGLPMTVVYKDGKKESVNYVFNDMAIFKKKNPRQYIAVWDPNQSRHRRIWIGKNIKNITYHFNKYFEKV